MALKVWNDKTWDKMIVKHPKLGVKSEGVAFAAAALESGSKGLTEVQANAKALKVRLKFSGASIGSAKICMGLAKKRSKNTKAKKRGRPVGSRNSAKASPVSGLPLDTAISRVSLLESELDALKQTLTTLRRALYGS